jgi:hypothetical protein
MEILATVDPSLLFLVAERHIRISSHMTPPRDGEDPSTTKLIKRPLKKGTSYGLLLMDLLRNKTAGESWMTPL